VKSFLQIVCIASLLGIANAAHPQARSTAESLAAVQIGAGWTIANPDYGQRNVQGFSIFGDIDFRHHLGIEGDIHRASMITPTRIGVDSYLLGPRYVYHYKRFSPSAKVLFGVGRFKYKFENSPQTAYTYKIYALGGGLDIRATRRIVVRAVDFEYQKWPGYPPTGLTPFNFSCGAAYAF
jgi:hypothetical protein